MTLMANIKCKSNHILGFSIPFNLSSSTSSIPFNLSSSFPISEKRLPQMDDHIDDYKSKDNGLCTNDNHTQRFWFTDHGVVSNDIAADNHVNGPAGIARSMQSPPLPDISTTKGKGLRKWRRIKRNFVKDQTTSMDSFKVLKRGLSGSADPTKPQHTESTEINQDSESRIRPVNISENTNVASEFMMDSPGSDSRFAVGAVCAASTDSENSEDRSSQSSTAASMAKVIYDMPSVSGYMHGKSHTKNLSGKTVSSQGVQQGKGLVESSKKPRGERVKIEKEYSQSVIESDSRSSNFGFMLGPFSMASNGKQGGNSMGHDEKNGDEANEGEDQINEEVQSAYRKENSGEIEELSLDDLAADLSWKAKEEKSEINQFSPNQDPLVKSILSLRSVQEALENEIHKFGEIGKEPTSLDDGSVHVDSTFPDQETSSSDRLDSEKIRRSNSDSLETQFSTLTHKVKYLERKLEEARAVMRANDLKLSELETTSRSRKEEPGSTTELQQEKYREMEVDLDALFLQRMEAEIHFLALTRAVQELRVSVDTDEVLKTQKRVFKVTLCFLTQLVLLVLVLLFVVLDSSSYSGTDVPT